MLLARAVGSWDSIAAMVREGIGFGVALDAEFLPSDGLVPVPVADSALQVNHYAVRLP